MADDSVDVLMSNLVDCLIAGQTTDVVELLGSPLSERRGIGEVIVQAWRDTVTSHGTITGIGQPVVESARADGSRVAIVIVHCADQPFQLRATINAARQVTTFHLQPVIEPKVSPSPDAWTAPDYSSPSLFTESEVTIGPADLAVPAMLCLPKSDTPVAGAVLIPGSGPTDRDSTIGPNKPFKDLAWGLATLGIATIRFDKVTYSHPTIVAARPKFTAADEYLTHSTAAIAFLAGHPAIDSRNVFLLGHSQGATIAPRVAKHWSEERAEPHRDLAGIVLLAAAAQPIHHAAIRQLRYLAGVGNERNPAIEEALTKLARQASVVDDENLSESTPNGELPFSIPAAYWLDLLAHDPLSIATHLALPMLFLQGGRDYQVTTQEDLRTWQTTLADSPKAQFLVYPTADHYFFTGTQPSTPASYQEPQHVDSEVINDVARWIAETAD
ncbi:alpha/beta hydrolase family protein [Mycolicibacterium smegmatis]|uniref:Alpha/beta hydrolase family protein n=1 Tax=Mycolicibacterium smegmatis (strain MKD8) TaxID=1214915 RepID=A0A2U9PV19_MYCSE|nr:alpha/beta fold hydrolase [Mycolicibacterium smegmatis]AWT55587.1 Alpha/beta hydrolase family protein [Mycolicibacterium smegmatis MKD8]